MNHGAYAKTPFTMDTQALVLGSGLAGLTLALKIAEHAKVVVCSKTELAATNSAMAQGGIAAVMSEEDSFEKHIEDTVTAGAGLCDLSAVRHIIESGPDRIRDLLNWGVRFDLDSSAQVALTREGGHSARRIVHISDHTGQMVHSKLLERVRQHPNIEILENHYAIDLIIQNGACVGAHLLRRKSGEVYKLFSESTFLATGGAGKVYLYTSNWDGATGDGIAMAYRAGASVKNLEFMQFHPTCLYHPEARNFLLTEALRGEGGELVDHTGRAFMREYHSLGSLAPRDIVARSMDREMKQSGQPCVFLDMTHLNSDFLRQRFPVIYQRCLQLGIDLTRTPIPVVPAAHYLCGGVMTDLYGRTTIHGLYALGETGCTGLHGANRLASNSLLECLVISHNAAENFLADSWRVKESSEVKTNNHNSSLSNPDEMIVIHHMWDEIRTLMWNYVGIVRTNRRLRRAADRLALIQREIQEYYSAFRPHSDIEELRNIALVADLTVRCALSRRESRGIHYNLDYPETSPSVKNFMLSRSLNP